MLPQELRRCSGMQLTSFKKCTFRWRKNTCTFCIEDIITSLGVSFVSDFDLFNFGCHLPSTGHIPPDRRLQRILLLLQSWLEHTITQFSPPNLCVKSPPHHPFGFGLGDETKAWKYEMRCIFPSGCIVNVHLLLPYIIKNIIYNIIIGFEEAARNSIINETMMLMLMMMMMLWH